jgi:hypothetical protein
MRTSASTSTRPPAARLVRKGPKELRLQKGAAKRTRRSADHLPSDAGHLRRPGDYRIFAINARDSCSRDRTSRRSA